VLLKNNQLVKTKSCSAGILVLLLPFECSILDSKSKHENFEAPFTHYVLLASTSHVPGDKHNKHLETATVFSATVVSKKLNHVVQNQFVFTNTVYLNNRNTHKINTALLFESPQLTPIPLPLEIEVQMQDPPLKCAFEALFVTVLPFLVDDAEGTVFVRRSSMNPAFVKEECS